MDRTLRRRNAVIIGVLFWISNLVTVAGAAIAGVIPSNATGLAASSPHAPQLVAGTLVAQINEAAIIGYAVVLFPLLKRQGQAAALGYVAFKVVEAVLLLAAATTLLALITSSQHGGAGSATSAFSASANLALAGQFWASRLAALAYVVATSILNLVLYKSLLVPRFISVWGFAAVAMLALGLALGIGDPTRGFQPGQFLVVPMILWELLFATWLIVRGFSRSPIAAAAVPTMTSRPGSLLWES